MSKEIVCGTAHKYNWCQVGAAINHPEHGKIMDISQAVSDEIGIPDAYIRIWPWNGYGDPNLIRHLLATENISAIIHFTDPRFWLWLYQMEHEIRQHCAIIYYNIWDDDPFPRYNRDFYRSSDALFSISKQTFNINKQVLGEENVITI